jgi:hypothetical protein
MKIENDENGSFLLVETIEAYYRLQGRECRSLGREVHENESIFLQFIIDKKHIIGYALAIDTRNYYTAPSIGIGPCFVDPWYLMGFEFGQGFSMANTSEAVEQNLKLLDQYFDQQAAK